eukprot:GABW01000238.1.p2 GENE.GABW01000238.1~~GABW01000238.1.p2  ORF type:complete len:56 (-),score=4.44 GABW01000238.1:165-332(-)
MPAENDPLSGLFGGVPRGRGGRFQGRYPGGRQAYGGFPGFWLEDEKFTLRIIQNV